MTAGLITEMATTTRQIGGQSIQQGYTGKRMIHMPGGMEKDSMTFHLNTQNCKQFKTYELLSSEIFPLIFSDCC